MSSLQTNSLQQFVQSSGAIQTGHFKLASGLHASRFFRCIQLFRDPKAAQVLFNALADRFTTRPIHYVLGANEAGSILAFEIAKRVDAEVAIARQKEEQYRLMTGFSLQPGDRVLIVDDITTTGGTAKQLLEIVRTAKADAIGVGVIATKGLFNIDLGCPTEVLITLENMDAIPPEACPLCQQGIPLSS